MRLVFKKDKDTKNYTRYVQIGNDMNRIYLPRGLPDILTFEQVPNEVLVDG